MIVPKYQRPTLYGIKETSINSKAGFILDSPLDTWVPEARGSSARVFAGRLAGIAGKSHSAAVKVMRHNRIEYSLPLFREEARILTLLQDVPGVTPLLECGYILLDEDYEIPPEEKHTSAQNLTGRVQRFGLDSVHNFLTDLESKVGDGWLPYLAIEKQDWGNNLLLLCDTGHTRGRFLPILEGLMMGIQICDILEAAHARNITFRDHKILHYYWQAIYNGIFVIDWNIARRYPEGVPDAELQFDLVQFGARTLHYILTGRPAPGALPMGPNKPEEIDTAARSYSVHWTYDDQRLPGDIKELLGTLLAGSYSRAKQLKGDLHSIFNSLSELA
jgi:serine/threonine protein kinase